MRSHGVIGSNEAMFIGQIIIVSAISILCRALGSQALVSWLCIQSILANLLVLKMVNLFGLDVTVSDAFTIGSLYCLNLLREDYDQAIAKKAVTCSFILLLTVGLLLSIHLAFKANTSDRMGPVYQSLFSAIIPIITLSGCLFLLTQLLDYFLFNMMKSSLPSRQLAMRMFISISITQVIDTALFTYWALGSWVAQFWHVFFWSYCIKVFITLIVSASSLWRFHRNIVTEKAIRYVQV